MESKKRILFLLLICSCKDSELREDYRFRMNVIEQRIANIECKNEKTTRSKIKTKKLIYSCPFEIAPGAIGRDSIQVSEETKKELRK